jgi:cytochrome c553
VRTGTIAAGFLILSLNPLSVEAAEPNAGADLAKRVCATCHGAEGNSLSPTFPRLAGQPAAYVEVQIKAFRDRTRADPHARAYMWGMASQLTDDVIRQLASYYAAQPAPSGEAADGPEIARGREIFEQGIGAENAPACRTCHGDKAQGQGAVPRLAGQHRQYLEQQLAAFASNLRENETMHENSKTLTAADISAVAAFLSAY